MGINIDADPMNADWAKQMWDLPVENVDDLRKWLATGNISVEEFKRWPVYKLNVDKPEMTWLKDL